MEFDISFEEDSLNNMALTPSQELKVFLLITTMF
jgi:hypothetical protein